SFVGSTALLILHVSSEGSAILAKGRFEITFQFKRPSERAIRRRQMVLGRLQSQLQFRNGGIRIIFFHEQLAQQIMEIKVVGPDPNRFFAFDKCCISVAETMKSFIQSFRAAGSFGSRSTLARYSEIG